MAVGELRVIKRVKQLSRFVLLGPPMCLAYFAYVSTGIVITDLIVFRTCLVSMGINITNCSILRANADSPEAIKLEIEIEPYASVIVMIKSLIDTLMPATLCLFLGPWSDRAGRRPLLLSAVAGLTTTYAILSLISNWNISPWYLLLASMPAAVVGGMYAMELALVCHISDSIGEKNRTVHLALIEASISSGFVIAGFFGPIIYENFGYAYSFATAAASCASALIYIYFFVPESVEDSSKESIRGLFRISYLKDLVASTSTKREGFHRTVVLLAIATITLFAMLRQGTISTGFLFTRARLGWDVQHYSHFDASGYLLWAAGLSLLSLRNRVSGASDTLFAGISLMSALGSAITTSFAWKSWHMYLTMFIGMFSGMTPSLMRSVVSKYAPAQDHGKVLSLTALLEILSAAAGPTVFAFIYSRSLPPIYPSPVHLFCAGMIVLSLICVACIHILISNPRETPQYTAAAQDDVL